MREIEKSKVKLKLWMVEKRASKKFEEISSKKKKSNKSKNMLKWIRSNFECLSLENRESHQKLIHYYEKKYWR